MKHFIFFSIFIAIALQIFAQAPAAKTPLPMILSTARPVAKIDSTYPFDIALREIDSTETASKEVLPQNGRPTVLAFWLTTCYPCMLELDAYTKKYADWQAESPFNLVAISTDFPAKFQRIGQVVREKNFPFPAFWDFNREFREILPGGLNGLPQVFIFDKNGILVWQHRKFYSGAEDEMFKKVKELNGQ